MSARSFEELRTAIDPAFASSQAYAQIQKEIAALVQTGGATQRQANIALEQAASKYMGVATASERAAASQRAAEAAVQDATQSYAALRMSVDSIYASSKRYEAAQEQVNAAVRAGVINQAEANRTLAMAESSYLGMGRAATSSNAAVGAASSGMNSFAFQSRMAAMQLSQVAQQTMAGGGFIRALAIQLPDLALGFGAVGIAAGVAAGVILPLAANFITGADNAKALEESIDRLSIASEEYIGINARAKRSVAELALEFGGFATEIQRTYDILQAVALERSLDGLNAAIASLDTGGLEDFVAIIKQGPAELEVLNDTYNKALAGLRDEFGLTGEQAVALVDQLNLVKTAEGPDELVRAADQLNQYLIQAFGSAQNIPPELRDMVQRLAEAQTVAARMGATVDGSADAAARLASTIGGINFSSARAGAALLAADLNVNLEKATALMVLLNQTAGIQATIASRPKLTFGLGDVDPEAANRAAVSFGNLGNSAESAAARVKQINAANEALSKSLKAVTSGGGSASKSVGGVGKAAKEAADELKYAEREAERLSDELNRPMIRAIDNVSSAFGDFIAGGLRNFKDFAKSILSSFTGMISQMVSAAARQRIMFSMGLTGGGATAAAAGQVADAAPGGGILSGLGSLAGGKGILGSIASKGIFGASGVFGSMGSSIGTSIGGALAGPGSALATSLGGIGASIGAVVPILGIAAAAFSFFRKKVKLLDGGLRVTTEGMDALIETFKDEEIKRFWGLSKKRRISYTEAEADVADPIMGIIAQMQGGVLDLAGALGVGRSAFADFSHQIQVSTKDMSEEEAQQAIAEALAGVGNAFADLVPNMAQFAREGEQSTDTLGRIVSDLGAVNLMMDTLGHTLQAASVIGAGTASDFAAMFGGIEAMNNATTAFYMGFYSEAERFATAQRQIEAQFAALNIAMPATRAQFRAMVDALDLTTVGGRETYAALVSMSGALDAILPAVASLTVALAGMIGSVTSEIDAMIGTTSEAMRANEQAAALWYRTADTLRAFIADMRGTAGALISGGQARAFSEARFQSLLASAIGGDNQAAGDLTTAARTLLDNTRATARSSLEVARAEARVLADLQLASGVSDIEGARHDVVAGLLGQQVELLGTVRDAINSGNPLESSDIAGLNGQLGALEGAIKAAEMINYAFLKERLSVTVDLLATANLPQDVRTLIANTQNGIEGTIDFIVRTDLAPDQKWLALTGSSEHIKTVEFIVDNSQWSQAAQDVALGTAGTYMQTVRFLAQNTMSADLTGLALSEADTLLKSIKFTAQALPADVRAIVFNQIAPLQKRINFMLGDTIPDDMQSLALDDADAFKRTIDLVAGNILPAKLQTLALSSPTGFARTLNILAGRTVSSTVADLALDAAKSFTRVINLQTGQTVNSTTARLALDTIGALNRTINLTAGAKLDDSTRRIALTGSSELSRVVNVSLSSGANADAIQMALANAGTYAVAVRASLNAAPDVREIVFGDTGSYAAMIEAAFGPISADVRRVLLQQQGVYAVNVLGTLGSGTSAAVQTLLLNANTTAVRGVTVAMAFASSVDAAERDLLLTSSKTILRSIQASVNPAGITPAGALYLDQLYAGDGTVTRRVDGYINLARVYGNTGDNAYFNILRGADTVTRRIDGYINLSKVYGNTGDNAYFNILRTSGAVTRSVFGAINLAQVYSSAGGNAYFNILRTSGAVTRSIFGAVNTSAITGTNADYFEQLRAGSGSISRVINGAVNLGSLSTAQKSLLEAVQGNNTGTLKLGGAFTFDPAGSFQTWFGNTTQASIAAPMASLSASLSSLEKALRVEGLRSQFIALTGQRTQTNKVENDAARLRLQQQAHAIAGIPQFATGVTNFAGGLAQINERGGEIVRLPSGADVIPHDLSRQMINRAPQTRPMMGNDNAEVVRELRELRKELSDLTRQAGTFDAEKVRFARKNNTLLERQQAREEGVL
tara:strand:+ start:11264 stop:17131 length:5868 start_codon:yes stop_codon:yes gene_type:complete